MNTMTALAFHVLAMPTGAVCNRQQLQAQGAEATIAWQGGEPTLMQVLATGRSC